MKTLLAPSGGPLRLIPSSLIFAILLIAACDTADPGETGEDTDPDLGCRSTQEMRIYVPPRATYLRISDIDYDLGVEASVPTRLADLNIQPGDQLRLERLGEFQFNSQHPDLVYYGLLVLFSESSDILAYDQRHRVPGAIAAGVPHTTPPTHSGGHETDIPEDFVVGIEPNGDPAVPVDDPVYVEVPEGAQYLFLSPADDHFFDNIDEDEDFALCITVVSS